MVEKASGTMDSSSDVGSAEDVVQALLEYLVDPMLPLKSSAREAPSLSQQQLVAKQVHAVVLLYDYYQRRRHPDVEFLGFESFCKLAVTLKPALMAHMKLMHRSDYTELDDLENQISLTEKAIMDACNISLVLDASKDVPSAEGWPISKVAVLLIDSRKENCLLLFSSITQGVWSVIEKDLDVSNATPEGMVEGKHINKRKRITKKRDEMNGDEAGYQQLAYSAVKEATGINQTDLIVLESHVVYSISKEKAAARFYIVQCTQSINEDLQVSIRDAIKSLQGPLVKKSSRSWTVTPVVEYFHVLPYAGIVSDWLSREMFSDGMQDLRVGLGNVDVNSSQRTDNPCNKEIIENRDNSNKNCGVADSVGNETIGANTESPKHEDNSGCHTICLSNSFGGPHGMDVNSSQTTENPCNKEVIENGDNSKKNCRVADSIGNETNGANTESPKQKDNNGCRTICTSDSFGGPRGMDVDDSSVTCPQNEDRSKKTRNPIKVYHHQKRTTSSMENAINASTSGQKVKVEMVDSMVKQSVNECRDEKVDAGNKICSVIPSDQDGMSIDDHALVPIQLNSKYLEKLQVTMASKENALSQTALRVLLRKREKLSRHLRVLEDEIAVCDKNIQTILDGGEDDLALKMEAIIDGCNDVCLKSESQTQYRICQHLEDQGSLQYMKRKRLSEAILTLRNPCQELDDICYENNWTLPTYHVSPSDGGFLANVTVKGMDFDCSGGSDLRSTPREARESAAAQMITKLQNMAGQTQ
uniref:DRBM domain-containing protein n=1 Tax=Davidia involucrata TaxID=16924 RepID=A0A5B7BBS7_DAVIN